MHTRDMIYQLGGVPVPLGCPMPRKNGRAWFVDGSTGIGSDSNTGRSLTAPFATVTQALKMAAEYDTVFVLAKKMAQTDTDPGNYTDAITIKTPSISIIGAQRGRTQGGLPQFQIGSGAVAQITVEAPGVYLAGLGINNNGSTGGGIKILDDGGTTYSAFGLTIENCHFKNNACHATNGSLGGAIYWGSQGGGWQILIRNNRFYKNLADIVLVGTSLTVPQDVVIEGNVFSGPAASVDVNIKTAGSGINGLIIRDNDFPCWPAIGAGSNVMPLSLTGSVGLVTSNTFGCTGKTFGAAANSLVPTTMLLTNNYQESGLIART